MKFKKYHFYIFLAILFWSTVASAFKIALLYITMIQLLLISSLVSLCVFFAMGFKEISRSENNVLSSAFYGALNPALYYIVLFAAYDLLPAQVAQPINYTWPVVLTVLSVIFLKQKARHTNYIGIGISFLGVFVVSFFGRHSFRGGLNAYGVLLAFASAFVWASYWVLNLKDKRPESVKLFFNFLFGTVYVFAVALFTRSLKSVDAVGVLAAIYVGVFETGVTYFLFIRALKLSGSSAKIGNLVYLSPFLSLFFIKMLVHERILLGTVLGLVLIVLGILIGNSST